jgi:NADH-quinone oxidoreductase subunit K
MSNELALLNNLLLVGAVLFGVGLVGFVSRRNMIVMFLSIEIMLLGVSLSLAVWSRLHNNFSGQMLVLFMVAVAACEAAVALTMVLMLFRRRGNLDIAAWRTLHEANQPPCGEPPSGEPPSVPEEPLPRLARAGARPDISAEETDYRPQI